MPIFVGLDCGGSSCRVLAQDEEGNIVFQGQSGPANLVSTPIPRLRRSLATALRDCPEAHGVCGCFAGLLNESHRALAVDLLRELMPGTRIHAEPDYSAAFYASNPGTSLCVIAGTGSLVCTKVEGKIVKGGGRGYLLGDEGSAFAYGRAALRHYLDDPAKASIELRQAIQKVFGPLESTEIVAEVYRLPTPASHLAKLSRAFGTDVQRGEPYALQALDENSRALATVVESHVEHAHPDREIRICLVGGLWKGTTVFSQAFETHLKDRLPNRIEWVQRTNTPPVYGAVAISKEIFG